METAINVDEWETEHQAEFAPPVCNRLLHKKQLSVMFVGGPNLREDFHIEHGSEFFYQMRGNMELPTMQQNQRKLVKINEGQVYLIPSLVPHAPQRPEQNSFGLVVERERYQPDEKDGLRFYTNFLECKEVLWERYFFCYDLGRDLVPVVKAFLASEESKTRIPGKCIEKDPVKLNTEVVVPDPFDLQAWIDRHMDRLRNGEAINLFEGHPDKEITVLVVGGPHESTSDWKYETCFMQRVGSCTVTQNGKTTDVPAGSCFVVEGPFSVKRAEGSIGMQIKQDPLGNK
eukprot:GEMP01055319.1.p1 GENE.GEMP01055319.1~~GEMP01055319.1.p1  ORF type:complete len:287 (+),score=61.42 GEMP01055319.1:69-929(+)